MYTHLERARSCRQNFSHNDAESHHKVLPCLLGWHFLLSELENMYMKFIQQLYCFHVHASILGCSIVNYLYFGVFFMTQPKDKKTLHIQDWAKRHIHKHLIFVTSLCPSYATGISFWPTLVQVMANHLVFTRTLLESMLINWRLSP